MIPVHVDFLKCFISFIICSLFFVKGNVLPSCTYVNQKCTHFVNWLVYVKKKNYCQKVNKPNKYMDLHVVLYVCAQRWNLDSTSYKEVEINTTTTNPALEYFGPTSVMGWTVSSRAAHILCGSVIGSDWAIHVSVRQARQLASASYTVYTTGVRYNF